MVILDTSFLFAYFNKKDTNHKKAVLLASELDNYTALLPVEVFEELMTVITYKISSKEAAKVGELLLGHDSPVKLMHSDKKTFDLSWKFFQSLEPHKFSFIDCILITLAKEFQCQIFTFDKKMDKIANG